MEIKDIIRNRRVELELTMKQLAEKVGVSEGTISRWESGEIANMRRDKVKALADALGTTPAVIMGWEEPAPDIQLDQSEKRLIMAFRASDPARQGIIKELLGVDRR